MVAKFLTGFVSTLTHVLEPDDLVIPLKDDHVALGRLAKDDTWTTLLIQDNVGFEVVKLLRHRGKLALERGLSGTTPRRFPIGSCISFAPTDELIKAMICETNCCPDGVDETYGEATETPSGMEVGALPKNVVGSVTGLLGLPTGFMLVNGKKVPFYE